MIVAPSILSADFCRLGEEAEDVLRSGADWLHVDVMDGQFVPNISFGFPVMKALRKRFPSAYLDVHLMIDRPERYVEQFCRAGADMLTFHVEAAQPQDILESLRCIHALGKSAGLVLKPKTPAEVLAPYLDQLEMVLVMTVEPGFGGQSFMEDQLPKLRRVRSLLAPEQRLEVDGGISASTAGAVIAAGADVLVAGSAVFGAADRAAAIAALKSSGQN